MKFFSINFLGMPEIKDTETNEVIGLAFLPDEEMLNQWYGCGYDYDSIMKILEEDIEQYNPEDFSESIVSYIKDYDKWITIRGIKCLSYLDSNTLFSTLQYFDPSAVEIAINKLADEGKLFRKSVQGITYYAADENCSDIFNQNKLDQAVVLKIRNVDMDSDEEESEEAQLVNKATEIMSDSYSDEGYKEAYDLFVKAAEDGSSIAMFNLGFLCAKGAGVPRDFEKAVEWMEKASEAGDDDADGCIELFEEGKTLIEKAESGDGQACADACIYFTRFSGNFNIVGEEKDLELAFEYAKKSAEASNAEGLYCLSLCYQKGRGTEEDQELAKKYVKQASDLGHAPAIFNYAVFLLNNGETEEGSELVLKSADGGYPLAMQTVWRLPDIDDSVAFKYTVMGCKAEPENFDFLMSAFRMSSIAHRTDDVITILEIMVENDHEEEEAMLDLYLYGKSLAEKGEIEEDFDIQEVFELLQDDDSEEAVELKEKIEENQDYSSTQYFYDISL